MFVSVKYRGNKHLFINSGDRIAGAILQNKVYALVTDFCYQPDSDYPFNLHRKSSQRCALIVWSLIIGHLRLSTSTVITDYLSFITAFF